MNILIVAAHPDDELLGAGGTWAKHISQGDTVMAMIISRGRDDPIDQVFDGFCVKDFITKIEAMVSTFKPDIVYTHFSGDINKDHQVIHEAVKVACRPFKSPVKAVYGFDSTFSLFHTFKPNKYVTLDRKDVLWKINEMKRKYSAEMNMPYRKAKGIWTQAKFWGMKVNSKYAEPYEVISEIS